MALSKVDICNLALAHIGKQPIATETEQTAERRACFQFYDQSRLELLSRSDWTFAQRVQPLAERPAADNPLNMRYRYWYALPVDLVKPVRLLRNAPVSAIGSDGRPIPVEQKTDSAFPDYELVGGNLFTQVEQARLLYVYDLQDPTRLPPLFVSALAALIARYAAIPLTRSDRVAALVERASETLFARAVAADAAGQFHTYARAPDVSADRVLDIPDIWEDV